MNTDEIVSGLMQELRRGTLIMLVLSRLDTPMYGYDLVKQLDTGGVPVEANTLYPLMRRLESQGLLKSQWETGGSKPRKYYESTPMGREVLKKITTYWREFSAKVDAMLKEEAQ